MTENDGNAMPTNVMEIVKQFDFLSIGLGGKIHCSLTNRDIPVRVDAVQQHLSSKKLKKQKEWYNADFSKYEPLIVPHKTNSKLLYCTLTHTELNRIPSQVELHVNGKRFKRRKLETEREKETRAAPATTASSEEEFWAPGGDDESDEGMTGGESHEEGEEEDEEMETDTRKPKAKVNVRRKGDLREVHANGGSANRRKEGKTVGKAKPSGEAGEGPLSAGKSATMKSKARHPNSPQNHRLPKEGKSRLTENQKLKAGRDRRQKGTANRVANKSVSDVAPDDGKRSEGPSADVGGDGPDDKSPVLGKEARRQGGAKGNITSDSDVVKMAKKHRVKGALKRAEAKGEARSESIPDARMGSGGGDKKPSPSTKRKHHALNGVRRTGKKARA